MKAAVWFLAAICASALLWGALIFAYLLYPAATLIGVFLLVLIAIGAYETGPHGAWARSREASARLQERQAERDLYPWRTWV